MIIVEMKNIISSAGLKLSPEKCFKHYPVVSRVLNHFQTFLIIVLLKPFPSYFLVLNFLNLMHMKNLQILGKVVLFLQGF